MNILFYIIIDLAMCNTSLMYLGDLFFGNVRKEKEKTTAEKNQILIELEPVGCEYQDCITGARRDKGIKF